ncbi:MAG TPA: GH3 auxin-responsive promoter family protein [Planctomycetaceae bacterium]|nr:GH3 auxin-responsive promoter family protein [Planctomycetaceae bacterium]
MLNLPKLVPRAVFRSAVRIALKSQQRRFEGQFTRASQVQRDWTMHRVRQCETTTFGKDHGFGEIRSFNDFRRRVPVSDYSYFAPYINAVAAGDRWALIPDQDSLIQFTITTGSTGVPKLNPVTASWIREYRQGWDFWGTRLFADHPQHIGSRILQMAGTWDMGRTPGGHQISMVSALLARMQSPAMKPFYAIPEALNNIKDPSVRHYVALRLSILDDIGWIMLMNPGTLIRLAEIGDQHKDVLIRDVFNGTLSDQFEIPDSIRTALRPFVPSADRRGAKTLEDICNKTGRLLPRDYWNQPVIGCWLGGTAGFPSRYLHEFFGESPLRDMGLVSSEGRHTIPFLDDHPFGVPSFNAGLYEFMPLAEADSRQPTVLEGHELTEGEDYRLVFSNSAGYFRFDIGDIVRCRGFAGQAPQIEFIQKSDRVGDLEGEKLTEHQITEGAHNAARSLGINLGLLTAVPRRIDRQKPWYDFLISMSDVRDEQLAKRFLQELDLELAKLNFLWKFRRNERVVEAPRLVRLPDGAWDTYIQQELGRRGTGDFQYKHPGLVQDQDWLQYFRPVDTILLE